jgi:hypothetical protein
VRRTVRRTEGGKLFSLLVWISGSYKKKESRLSTLRFTQNHHCVGFEKTCKIGKVCALSKRVTKKESMMIINNAESTEG